MLEPQGALPAQHVLGVGGEGLAAVGHLALPAALLKEHRLALRLFSGPLLPPALGHPPGGGVGGQLLAGAGVPAPVHPYAVRDDLPRFVFSGLYACHTVLSLLPALAGPGLPPGGDGVCSRGKSLASRRGAGAGTRWGRLRGPGPGRLSPQAGPKAHSSIPGKGEGCQNLGKPGFGKGKASPPPGRWREAPGPPARPPPLGEDGRPGRGWPALGSRPRRPGGPGGSAGAGRRRQGGGAPPSPAVFCGEPPQNKKAPNRGLFAFVSQPQ